MKDFLKIFFILCGLVAAFLYGRNYGEQTFKQSDEYRNFTKAKEEQNFLRSDIENAKAKLQNIIDGSDNKKSDELLAQILQVFLADLGIRIQNQKLLAASVTPTIGPAIDEKATQPVIQAMADKNALEPENQTKKEKAFDYKKLKSYEWILTNAQNAEDIIGNLKNVEIKDIDSYMKNSIESKPQDEETVFGSYRGRIMDINNKEFGTLVLEIASHTQNEKALVKGSLKIFKNGKEETSNEFSRNKLGYRFDGSSGIIINFANRYYQLYKVQQTQQIAGYFYERLVNGTTKTIGSFVLNRVDQF